MKEMRFFSFFSDLEESKPASEKSFLLTFLFFVSFILSVFLNTHVKIKKQFRKKQVEKSAASERRRERTPAKRNRRRRRRKKSSELTREREVYVEIRVL